MNTEIKNAVTCTDEKEQYDIKELDKLSIIGNEYDIPLEEKFIKDVSVMCNLSQGVEDRGIEKGIAIGEATIITNLYKNGLTVEQISKIVDKGIDEVKAVIGGKEPVLV